jgi:3-hydroxyacyl-[acyl-carrier-protein] dehydratase
MNGWYSLSNLQFDSGKNITANAVVPADSPWFSGHFPGQPILPGIAELSMILDLLKKNHNITGNKNNLIILSLKKVRFKILVKPEELLEIKVIQIENSVNTYSFRITAANKLTCSGIIAVAETN